MSDEERYEEIKKSNKYLEVRCIVPYIGNSENINEDNSPCAILELNSIGEIEVVMAIDILKDAIKKLNSLDGVKRASKWFKKNTRVIRSSRTEKIK